MDANYGSGFHDGFANMDQDSSHCPVDLGIRHDFKIGKHQTISLRFDVINVFDEIYVIHPGPALGPLPLIMESAGESMEDWNIDSRRTAGGIPSVMPCP